MNLIYVDNKEDMDNWDDFVTKSPQGSVFSKTCYLDALKVKYKILAVVEKGGIIGGIVLAKNEINTFSNPMLDKYLGILLPDNPASPRNISKNYKIISLLSDELKKIKSFDYYFHPSFNNWIPLYWQGYAQQTRYTYRLSYNKSIEDIIKNFNGNLKNHIKFAQKNNVVIKKDVPFEEFHVVINKTFLRQGSKAPFNFKRLKYFIAQLTKENKFFSFGAYYENNLVAVCGLVYDKDAAYLILNGIDIENHIRGANALMLLNSIEFFEGKTNYFDFEGSMLMGVEQFYRGFGGELTPYMQIWNDNIFNYIKRYSKKIYKKLRYGR